MLSALTSTLVRLPIESIVREYPNKLDHVLTRAEDAKGPRDLHPAFYGSFDWHSAVHGHWALVRMLRLSLAGDGGAVREVLRQNLTEENLRREAEYLDEPERGGFERPYGWTWLLKLACELHGFQDEEAQQWRSWLRPLEDRFVQRYLAFFPKQTYPIRVGTHANTAFGFTFALEYARLMGARDLETLILERSKSYFGGDRRLPMEWEPSGADFLSPSLMEAHLMRLALPPSEFGEWLQGAIGDSLPENLRTPAEVTDRHDGQLSHLDGLNLSRAWNMKAIAAALDDGHPLREDLLQAGGHNLEAGLQGLTAGTYEGDHWLASFAILALFEAD